MSRRLHIHPPMTLRLGLTFMLLLIIHHFGLIFAALLLNRAGLSVDLACGVAGAFILASFFYLYVKVLLRHAQEAP